MSIVKYDSNIFQYKTGLDNNNYADKKYTRF